VIRNFPIKRLQDGRALLNLGCGTRMHHEWNNVDFSYYARLARRPRLSRLLRTCSVLSEDRYARLMAIDPHIVAWDLRRGVPFPGAAFDVVYHSHVLEHLDRRFVAGFLGECRRVLKPGGLLRIVVPDLETLVRGYVTSLPSNGRWSDASLRGHEQAVERLLEQLVRVEPFGVSEQSPIVRIIERVVRGDARQAGEIHRWMYDRYTLQCLLRETGFSDVAVCTESTSRVPDWQRFGLDVNPDGSPYIDHSLYVEASC
jgi:SAM-dependent methyltransferase